jgi:glycosyltransferase involved in cell wall biosynthesis
MSNETTSEARKRLKIPVDNIVIGFRADYSMYKGLDLILFALNKLASEFGDMPITIITFQEKNTLKTVEDKFQVIDLGWVGGEDVHKYYPAMNFFLMPSKAEAFGLMAVEAMMHGVFPLVTHGTALESLLMDPEHSLVSLHDAESYFDLIVKALLNYKYYSKLKKDELQGWALKEYSSMKFIEKLSKIYTQEYARFHHF